MLSGVRASAAAVVAAEQGVRQGAQYLDLAVKNAVIPTVKKKVPAARGKHSHLGCTHCVEASMYSRSVLHNSALS